MHLFEFHDLPNVPATIRLTLLDILAFCNGPVRDYYGDLCRTIVHEAETRGLRTVVELGAGTAPLTMHLAALPAARGLRLVACDLYPDIEHYRELTKRHPDQVQGIVEPVDFTLRHDWGPGVLLVLNATFHHIPPELRRQTLAALTQSSDRVLIFEPIQNNLVSMLLALTSFFPAIASPLWLTRPGILRRVLWCWLVPIAPLMFVWDALVSCLRQWSGERWQTELATIVSPDRKPQIATTIHSAVVRW
ncbi:MAG: class I SAM-dependent methyltransferase [Planctomycetaceae bacterium]|nr:class I SAM-dependent methyltransferase [Planctomycetaceae bacterium]